MSHAARRRWLGPLIVLRAQVMWCAHLVRPLPFLLPVDQGDQRSLGKMRIGMALYDVLALYRNTARHRGLSAHDTLKQEPNIAKQGLRGSIRYYDCQEDDARFC